MRTSKNIVLATAIGAGLIAFLLLRSLGGSEPEVVRVETAVGAMTVLVAARDIRAGKRISETDLEWQDWPETQAANLIRKDSQPDAIEEFVGRVSRASLFGGEPIRESKLVESGSGGFLSAILPKGKLASATPVSPETGAGGFILPNDRVDVIVTRTIENANSASRQTSISETILRNVRVLAIDQTVEEQDDEQVVVGSVATLELSRREAEVLALAANVGEISLALRSVLDSAEDDETASDLNSGPTGTVRTVRFGQSGRLEGGQ
ncbi:MAG: Flp pilus assembly protein CpaB [Pseudomonadota bacterium]